MAHSRPPSPMLTGLPSLDSAQLQVSLAVEPDSVGGAHAVLFVRGEIDLATVGQLHAGVRAAVAVVGPRPGQPLVLDWRGVTFLDSNALHFLLDIHATGLERGFAVRLIPPQAPEPAGLVRFAADHGWLPPELLRQISAPAS